MATFELQEAVEAEAKLDFPIHPANQRELNRDSHRDELASYLSEMREFAGMEPGEVFLRLSAFTARASEIRAISHDDSRRGQVFRTQVIDPFLDECERQFRYHSRAAAMREFEWKIVSGSGGQHA